MTNTNTDPTVSDPTVSDPTVSDPTVSDLLRHVTLADKNFYGWFLPEYDCTLLAWLVEQQKVTMIGVVEKFNSVFNALPVKEKEQITLLYPDFVNKATTWIRANPAKLILNHPDYRTYGSFSEAFDDEGYRGCKGEGGQIIFSISRPELDYLPDIIDDYSHIEDQLNVANLEWFHTCWKSVFK